MKYDTVDDWLHEVESYSLRAERVPPEALPYIREAWRLGEEKAAAEIERLRAGGCAEVSAAVLAEREACAKIADALAESHKFWARKVGCYNLRVKDCKDIAAAIRARSP